MVKKGAEQLLPYVNVNMKDGALNTIVNAPDSAKVRLWWNGVSITNYSTAPVWIQNADKVVITLAEGSTNTLTDTADYVFSGAETKPNACRYAADDLTINGSNNEILTVIEDIVKRQDTTVMMVTHNPEIAKMANRVVKIRNGRIASIKRNINPLPASELEW